MGTLSPDDTRIYHKGATFIDREKKEKKSKDLYCIYFVLRHAPDIDAVLREVSQFKKDGYFVNVPGSLGKFFSRTSSPGGLVVERVNGPDEFISDLRLDVFERFNNLREIL